MCFQDLTSVIIGFALGVLGGPIKDYITNKQKARQLLRIIDVELESIGARLDDTCKKLRNIKGPVSWYERGVTFTESWFWNQSGALTHVPRKTLNQLITLRTILKHLESGYREIEQDISAEGRVVPREYVLNNFEQLRQNILSNTNRARELLQQVRHN